MNDIEYSPRVIMECHACGYQKRTQVVNWEEVIRYKSGPRKGEIKNVKEHSKDMFEADPDFIPLMIGKDAMDFTIAPDTALWGNPDTKPITVYACPECGTLKVKPTDLF